MKLAELFCALSDAEVSYVLVGGLAVQLHGYMRSTFDVDLVLAMDDDNLARFIDVANRLGLKPSIPVPIDVLRNAAQIEQWHREKGMLTFALREPQTGGCVVDVLVRPEVPFEQLLGNAVTGMLYSHPVWIASIDDLLTMKRIAGRPRITSTSRHWKRYGAGKTRMAEIMQPPRNIIPEEVMLARLARFEEMREFFIEMWRQNPALARQGGARVAELLAPLEDRGHRTEDKGQSLVRAPRGLANRRGEAAAMPQSSVLSPQSSERGVSLVELIMFIVIVSVALAGLLLVMDVTTKGSADPLIHKQALAIAESLLEEVELMPFTFCDPNDANAASAVAAVGSCAVAANEESTTIGPEALETRYDPTTPYDNVSDYHGYDSTTDGGIKDITGNAVPALSGYSAAVSVVETDFGGILAASGDALQITVTVTTPNGTPVTVEGIRTRYAPRTTP